MSPLGVVTIFFFFCMKALKISVVVKNDPARQMSFIFLHFQVEMESTDSIHEYLKPGV